MTSRKPRFEMSRAQAARFVAEWSMGPKRPVYEYPTSLRSIVRRLTITQDLDINGRNSLLQSETRILRDATKTVLTHLTGRLSGYWTGRRCQRIKAITRTVCRTRLAPRRFKVGSFVREVKDLLDWLDSAPPADAMGEVAAIPPLTAEIAASVDGSRSKVKLPLRLSGSCPVDKHCVGQSNNQNTITASAETAERHSSNWDSNCVGQSSLNPLDSGSTAIEYPEGPTMNERSGNQDVDLPYLIDPRNFSMISAPYTRSLDPLSVTPLWGYSDLEADVIPHVVPSRTSTYSQDRREVAGEVFATMETISEYAPPSV